VDVQSRHSRAVSLDDREVIADVEDVTFVVQDGHLLFIINR
jgi:hypothetical protein